MKNRFLLIFLLNLFFNFSISVADNTHNYVRIKGCQADYAGYYLDLKTKEHIFLYEEKFIGSIYVDSLGNFDFTIPLAEVRHVYVDLGRIRGEIYLEPGKSYELLLPPFQPKRDFEMYNPFFIPESIPLGILNEESRNLNRQIFEFEEYFEYLFTSYASQIALDRDEKKAEEIIEFLESKFTDNHPTFVQIKKLSYIKIRIVSKLKRSEEIIKNYFLSEEWDYNLPIFSDVFSLLFKNYIPNKLEKEIKNEYVNSLEKGALFDDIVDVLTKEPIFENRPELAGMSFLYSLYQDFYNQTMSGISVVYLTKDAASSKNEEFVKELGHAQFKVLTKLRSGYPAPNFSLFNQDGDKKSLEDYKGKFVYLNFMNTVNIGSLRDFETLKNVEKQFKKDLAIVTVLLDEDEKLIDDFIRYNQDKKWDFLSFMSYQQVVRDYNIMAVPAYFLISPDGILTLSPAPSPDEDFRGAFVKELLAYNRLQQRKRGGTKWILGR